MKAGRAVIANTLRTLGEMEDKPETVVLLNEVVHLLCEGSHVLDHLTRPEGQGVQFLACTTCLEYFDLMGRLMAGKPMTMARTVRQMMDSEIIFI